MPSNIIFSHNFGDTQCTNISSKDRDNLRNIYQSRLNGIEAEDGTVNDQEEIEAAAREFGYDSTQPEDDHS